MLHRDLMIRANNGSFEKTPNVFESVSVNNTAYILFLAMVNCKVKCVLVLNANVARIIVSHYHGGFIRKFGADKGSQLQFGDRLLTKFKSYATITFNCAKHNFFVT